jgi:hypothetical protein
VWRDPSPEACAGAQVVVDLANSPSFENKAVLEFFETSGRNLLKAEAERSLVPLGEARLGRIGLDEWLRRSKAGA